MQKSLPSLSSALTEEEMGRIEAEELAAAQARQRERSGAQRRLAAHAYRQEVRAALRPRPFWWPARWALPFVPLLGALVFLAARPAFTASDSAAPEDVTGGIQNSKLIAWCREEVAASLRTRDLTFPAPAEAAGQMSANADGRTWDGWVAQRETGARTAFSCAFTASEGSVQVQFIPEGHP